MMRSNNDRARYESIHKAAQYKNSEAIQIAIISESDGITMSFKENFQCSKSRAPNARQTLLSNAEESGCCTKVL
jgi:hypothetical protein